MSEREFTVLIGVNCHQLASASWFHVAITINSARKERRRLGGEWSIVGKIGKGGGLTMK